jgi:hypothetical protein
LDEHGLNLCVERARDVDVGVRVAAVGRVARVRGGKLSGEQRRRLLAAVLAERDSEARANGLSLLRDEWYEREASGSATALLRLLDATGGGARGVPARLAARWLAELLRDVNIDPQFDTAGLVSPERALLWRVHAELFGTDDPYMPEVSARRCASHLAPSLIARSHACLLAC